MCTDIIPYSPPLAPEETTIRLSLFENEKVKFETELRELSRKVTDCLQSLKNNPLSAKTYYMKNKIFYLGIRLDSLKEHVTTSSWFAYYKYGENVLPSVVKLLNIHEESKQRIEHPDYCYHRFKMRKELLALLTFFIAGGLFSLFYFYIGPSLWDIFMSAKSFIKL